MGRRGVAREQEPKREGHEQVSSLDAVVLTIVEQSLAPG